MDRMDRHRGTMKKRMMSFMLAFAVTGSMFPQTGIMNAVAAEEVIAVDEGDIVIDENSPMTETDTSEERSIGLNDEKFSGDIGNTLTIENVIAVNANEVPKEARYSEAYLNAVSLFEALPSADSVTEENRTDIQKQMDQASAAFDVLGEEEQQQFEEEHADLLSAALNLSDILSGNAVTTWDSSDAVATTLDELKTALADDSVTSIQVDPGTDESITVPSDVTLKKNIIVTSGTLRLNYDSDNSTGVSTVCDANITVESGATIEFYEEAGAWNEENYLIMNGSFWLKEGAAAKALAYSMNVEAGFLLFRNTFQNQGTFSTEYGKVVVMYGTDASATGTLTGRQNKPYYNVCRTTPTKTSSENGLVYITGAKVLDADGKLQVGATVGKVVIDGFGEVTDADQGIFNIAWDGSSYGATQYIVPVSRMNKVVGIHLQELFISSAKSQYKYILVENGNQPCQILNGAYPSDAYIVNDAATVTGRDVVYVKSGNPSGATKGDSEATAFATLDDALTVVNANGTIVICNAIQQNGAINLNKPITITGSYNGIDYPDAALENKNRYIISSQIFLEHLAMRQQSGFNSLAYYFFLNGNGVTLSLNDVDMSHSIYATLAQSYKNLSVNVTDCVLPSFSVAGCTLTLDNAGVCSDQYLQENQIDTVNLKNGSTLITNQCINDLSSTVTDASMENLLVALSADEPLQIDGTVDAEAKVYLAYLDDQYDIQPYTEAEKTVLYSSDENTALTPDKFSLYQSELLLKKENNEIKTVKVDAEISGVSAETGLVYDGAPKKGYTGTPVCISSKDNQDVTAVCGALTYTWEGIGNTSYSSSTNAPVNAGDYRLTIAQESANDIYEVADKVIEFTISKADYDMSSIAFQGQTRIYNGQPQNLMITGTLPTGVTVQYAGNANVDAGTYTVTAQFTGSDPNYNTIPDQTAALTIVPADLGTADMVLAYTQTDYTGSARIPEAAVTWNGVSLRADVDYSLSYSNNINAGTAVVTATGLKNYTGTISKTFVIKKVITDTTQSITGVASSYIITCNGKKTLKAKADGKLTYSSSNSKIASISKKGVITTKRTGRVVITIKAAATSTSKAVTKKVVLYVRPVRGSITRITAGKGQLRVVMGRHATSTGYQIQYSANKNFVNAKTITIKGLKNNVKTMKGLKSKTKYYVRVRCYRTTSDKLLYGAWSKTKAVKTR